MRERISMKSKMLGALALFTLIGALFIMQSAGNSPPTVDAATGTIDALNMGTCLTTDNTVFKGDCSLADDDVAEPWEVREEIGEVTTLYATYAYDPKTSDGEPRVILQDSDLIKISIADADRDRRTGVLIAGDGTVEALTEDDLVMLTALGKAIQTDLDGDNLDYPDAAQDIEYTLGEFNFAVSGEDPDNTVSASGNKTINFGRRSGNVDFLPGDFDVDNGAVVRFFGCVDGVGNEGHDGRCDDASETVVNLKDYIEVDEDASNGEASGNTPPWLGINASVPASSEIVIHAIYYRTSDMESLIGGDTYRTCGNDTAPSENDSGWTCATGTLATSAMPDDIAFTDDEIEDNDPLVVLAEADGEGVGDSDSVNLRLQETGRFTGRYEGYLRLTDSNGSGKDTDGSTVIDWGREINHATGHSDADAAVLGVNSGPVTIEYVDSDGRRRTLRIEIDNQPPAIQIANPVHKSASDDHSPDFDGSFEDNDSGLVADSFRLVVDNGSDGEDNTDYVVEEPAAPADVMAPSDPGHVSHAGELEGTTYGPIGSVAVADLYNIGDDSCGDAYDGKYRCHIVSDDHDDGDSAATFSDTLRLNLQDGGEDAETRDAEFEVDFQAYVMDMAGNIGYSDSDPSAPRIINDLGEEDDRSVPNVFGYYSAHIISLDEKDPEVIMDQSATGFYGLDEDKDPVADRSAVMIAFDGPLAADSVSINTFSVALDDDTNAEISEVEVAGNYVFLKLEDSLASDATPAVTIVAGEGVEDRAGNMTQANEFSPDTKNVLTLNDGITPNLSVSLSGGSGTGEGDEGPSKLTKNRMTITIESDEDLQVAPQIRVVCSELSWREHSSDEAVAEDSPTASSHDIDDYIANRNRPSPSGSEPGETPGLTSPKTTKTGATGTYLYTCGYDRDPKDEFDDEFIAVPYKALNRPGNVWEFTWTESDNLVDGDIAVVAFGRDRSRYMDGDENNVHNWGSASANFGLDRDIKSPMEDGGGDLQPADGGTSKESRPFILIEFDEGTTVTLDSVELDDVEINDQFEEPNANRFVYWPATISQGDHEVEVEATDAAGNEVAFDYAFEVVERGDFVIELQAGWNAISVPASPVDTAIGTVFTDAAITTVIGWDTQGWRIAVRRDGVWESNQQYGALNDIQAKYGYWVKSDKFIDQPVALQGPISRNSGSPGAPIGIDTVPGWNFVGVIDQDGDQTEGDFGTGLLSGTTPVTAEAYLGSNYVRAYTWDPTFSRFEGLDKIDQVKIGAGVWVYYEGGIAP